MTVAILMLAVSSVAGESPPGLSLRPAPLATAEQVSLVRAELVCDVTAVEPGKPFRLGVLYHIKRGWHIYWRNPGDSGVPTNVTFKLPSGWTAGELQWPAPQRMDADMIIGYGYADTVLLWATVTPPADLPADQAVTLTVDTDWLACADRCVIGQAPGLALSLPAGQAKASAARDTFDQWAKRVPIPADAADSPAKVTVQAEGQQVTVQLAWHEAVTGVGVFPGTGPNAEVEDLREQSKDQHSTITFSIKPITGIAGVREADRAASSPTFPLVVAGKTAKGQPVSVSVPIQIPLAPTGAAAQPDA